MAMTVVLTTVIMTHDDSDDDDDGDDDDDDDDVHSPSVLARKALANTAWAFATCAHRHEWLGREDSSGLSVGS